MILKNEYQIVWISKISIELKVQQKNQAFKKRL